ncbi:MAG: hypothetical protein GWP04_11205 [Gammaproteobacteria bacterium]|nr:hypothetical protein [Gammaproteobacteria bacterium]
MQRTATLNQLRHIVLTAPDEVRVRFKGRVKAGLVSEAAAMRPRKGPDPVTYTTLVVIRGLARRIRDFNDEIAGIDLPAVRADRGAAAYVPQRLLLPVALWSRG